MLDMIGVELDGVEHGESELCSFGVRSFKTLKRQKKVHNRHIIT